MTIAEVREKCKSLIARVPRDIFVVGVVFLASSLSFGLGLLAGMDAGEGSSNPLEMCAASLAEGVRQVVASKNGTKYYLPECAGAERIAEANKVWFVSPSAATEAGYAPAANCEGM